MRAARIVATGMFFACAFASLAAHANPDSATRTLPSSAAKAESQAQPSEPLAASAQSQGHQPLAAIRGTASHPAINLVKSINGMATRVMLYPVAGIPAPLAPVDTGNPVGENHPPP